MSDRSTSRTVLLIWLAATLAFAFLVPGDPLEIAPSQSLQAPSWNAVAGTDRLGRDVLSRTAAGLRVSATQAGLVEATSLIAALATSILVIGLSSRVPFLSALIRSGLLGLRIVPPFVVALTMAVLLRRSPFGIAAALFFISFVYAQPVYEAELRQALRTKQLEGARALGAQWTWKVRAYLLPEIAPRVARYAALDFASLVAYEALFGFVGLTSPPTPSLGDMLNQARPYMISHPWLFVAPAAALTLLVAGGWQIGYRTKQQWR